MNEAEYIHLKELLQSHRRRLMILNNQAAIFGFNTRPEIKLEIEDIQNQIAQIEAKMKINHAGSNAIPLTNYQIIDISLLQGKILIVEPQITLEDAHWYIQLWIEDQDDLWPGELSFHKLVKNMRCVYLAHWLVNASAWCTWSCLMSYLYLAS